FRLPVREERRTAAGTNWLPPESRRRHPTSFEKFDADVVVAVHGPINRHRMLLALCPGVDHQLIINPDAHPVIHRGEKAVSAGREVDRARPTSREIITID